VNKVRFLDHELCEQQPVESIRRDRSAHDGYQAACLMFWKEAWLQRTTDTPITTSPRPDDDAQSYLDTVLHPNTRDETADGTRYRCQATDIPNASARCASATPTSSSATVLRRQDAEGRHSVAGRARGVQSSVLQARIARGARRPTFCSQVS
jgi:hypothetical protein